MNSQLRFILAVGLVFCIGASMASAGSVTTYEFWAPQISQDLGDLVPEKYYVWGIGDGAPGGPELAAMKLDLAGGSHSITSAKLYFDNIGSWNDGDNVLYIHVLNNVPYPGFGYGWDWEDPLDAFAGHGILINIPQSAWTSLPGESQDLELEFAHLTDDDGHNVQYYVENNPVLGLGFDPESRFYTDGIKLQVQVAPLPPAVWGGMILLGGMGVAAGVRRRLRIERVTVNGEKG